MKTLTTIWRGRSLLVVFAAICAIALLMSIWRLTATQAVAPAQVKGKEAFNTRIKNGLGREVRFATSFATRDQINGSVDSVAVFIASRSGLGMSDGTKLRLADMEQTALKVPGNRLTIERLSDALTSTLMERLGSITDKEAAAASAMLEAGHPGHIFLRAHGEGYYTSKQFLEEVKTLGSLAQKGDKSVRDSIYATLLGMVKDRVATFSEAVPLQFGSATKSGLTPLQALIVTYSLAADDYLTDSQDELTAAVRAIEKETRSNTPGTAYGVRGRLFSTPVNLFFNQQTVSGLLDRFAKGGK